MREALTEIEAAAGEMNEAFVAWTEACKCLQRSPDLPSRLEDAIRAHGIFLAKRKRYAALMEKFGEEMRFVFTR